MNAMTVELDQLFDSFTRVALRLETRDRYNVGEEAEPLRRFLAGEDPGLDWFTWTDRIAAAVTEGRRFQRVRVVPDPLTDYLQFETWLCRANVAAGESIGYLTRTRAVELGLPAYDYWLFDSEAVAVLHFDEDDVPQGAVVLTDPATVVQHRAWLDAAVAAATPYDQYVSTLDPMGSG